MELFIREWAQRLRYLKKMWQKLSVEGMLSTRFLDLKDTQCILKTDQLFSLQEIQGNEANLGSEVCSYYIKTTNPPKLQ